MSRKWEDIPEAIIEPAVCPSCCLEFWVGVRSDWPHARGETKFHDPTVGRRRLRSVDASFSPRDQVDSMICWSYWCPKCQDLNEYDVWFMVARNRSGEWRTWQQAGTVLTAGQIGEVADAVSELNEILDRIRASRAANGRGPWALERRGESVWIPYQRESLHRHGDPIELRKGRIQHVARTCYACEREIASGVVWRPAPAPNRYHFRGWWPDLLLANLVVCDACHTAAREPERVVSRIGKPTLVMLDGLDGAP